MASQNISHHTHRTTHHTTHHTPHTTHHTPHTTRISRTLRNHFCFQISTSNAMRQSASFCKRVLQKQGSFSKRTLKSNAPHARKPMHGRCRGGCVFPLRLCATNEQMKHLFATKPYEIEALFQQEPLKRALRIHPTKES